MIVICKMSISSVEADTRRSAQTENKKRLFCRQFARGCAVILSFKFESLGSLEKDAARASDVASIFNLYVLVEVKARHLEVSRRG